MKGRREIDGGGSKGDTLTSLSLVIVALICSDPGVTVKEDLEQTGQMDHSAQLRGRGDSLCLHSMFECLSGNACRATHVLV